MRQLLKSLFGALALATAVAAAPASATDFTLTFANNGGTYRDASTRDYKFTQGSETINVRVTAWTATGAVSNANSIIYKSTLGVYDKGLGVTSPFENGSSNTHTIDNNNGYDFVLLQFDTKVLLSSVTTTSFSVAGSNDSDLTYAYGNSTNPWNTTLSLAGSNTLSTILTQQSIDRGAGTIKTGTSGKASNLWLVAASMIETGKDFDGFKLGGATVVTVPVPEPATWMTMILGFGVAGTALRSNRRKTATATA